MNPITYTAFSTELIKIAAAKIKSNDRMPAATKANVGAFMESIHTWDSPHKAKALKMADKMSEPELFRLMHSMRRWYSGGSMSGALATYNEPLKDVMRLKPKDALGIYRGFKVSNDNPLAKLKPGQIVTIPVTRNRGVSSWSTEQSITNRFSGGGKGKTGLIIKLVGTKGVQPIVAPPSHTKDWFNKMYERTIGTSFRPNETEYLIKSPEIQVEVVRVKK